MWEYFSCEAKKTNRNTICWLPLAEEDITWLMFILQNQQIQQIEVTSPPFVLLFDIQGSQRDLIRQLVLILV